MRDVSSRCFSMRLAQAASAALARPQQAAVTELAFAIRAEFRFKIAHQPDVKEAARLRQKLERASRLLIHGAQVVPRPGDRRGPPAD